MSTKEELVEDDGFVGYVYCITNTINFLKYIGITKNSISVRWNGHLRFARNGKNTYLHKAINKHGKENFKIEVIDTCYTTREDLNNMEKKYIIELNTKSPFGYNLTVGGDGGDTWALSKNKEEIRKKISLKSKGHRTCEMTDELRERIRTGVMKTVSTPEFKEKHSKRTKDGLKKKGYTSERISELTKKGMDNPEVRKKCAYWIDGKRMSSDVIKKRNISIRRPFLILLSNGEYLIINNMRLFIKVYKITSVIYRNFSLKKSYWGIRGEKLKKDHAYTDAEIKEKIELLSKIKLSKKRKNRSGFDFSITSFDEYLDSLKSID